MECLICALPQDTIPSVIPMNTEFTEKDPKDHTHTKLVCGLCVTAAHTAYSQYY